MSIKRPTQGLNEQIHSGAEAAYAALRAGFVASNQMQGDSTPHCRRRKVRLAPFPPGGENYAHSLAPPLPTGTASLTFLRGTLFDLAEKKTGRGRSKRKERFSAELAQSASSLTVRGLF